MTKIKGNNGYCVAIERKEETLLRKEFRTLRSAEKWACETVRTFLVCEMVATVISNETGEIMTMITR